MSILNLLQVSVKDYLTQRFCNCRRLSQPTSSTQKYITGTIIPKTLNSKITPMAIKQLAKQIYNVYIT